MKGPLLAELGSLGSSKARRNLTLNWLLLDDCVIPQKVDVAFPDDDHSATGMGK
jgi:hypothetical protein